MLGKFSLDGIPPMPRGQPQIEVSFDVDANGILNVNAIEKSSGKEQKITITNDKGRLSKEEIEKMVEDAEKYKMEDEKVKMLIESKNKLESYVFNLESTINNEKIPMDENLKIEIKEKLEEVKDWLLTDRENISDYEEKQKELEKMMENSVNNKENEKVPMNDTENDSINIEEID